MTNCYVVVVGCGKTRVQSAQLNPGKGFTKDDVTNLDGHTYPRSLIQFLTKMGNQLLSLIIL